MSGRTGQLLSVLLLAGIVVLGFGLRAARLGADPPLSLANGTSEVVDGPWYLAEAADRARGLETDVFPQYRKPVFTAIMRVAFAGGVSLERAHAMEAAMGALLVALGAAAGWAAYGRRAALLGAVFLATSFVLVGYARTTLVYGPLAAGLAGVVALHARGLRTGSWLFLALAWAALAGLTLGLKVTAAAAAPALIAGHVVLARRRGLALAVGAGLAVLAGLLVWAADPGLIATALGKASGYLGHGGPPALVKRALRAPFASGLVPLSPVLLALAWGGVLLAVERGGDEPRAQRAVDAVLATWLVGWVLLFGAFEYPYYGVPVTPPLRHFIGALVPAALLAGRLLDRLLGPEGVALRASRGLVFGWATLGAYWALGSAISALWARLLADASGPAPAWLQAAVSFPALLAASALAGAAIAWRAPRPLALRLGPAAAAAIVLAALAADAARLAPVLVHPTYSLAEANRAVAAALEPGSDLYGPWAHALTYDAPRVRRHLPPQRQAGFYVEASRMTHLAIDGPWTQMVEGEFAARGTPLIPLLRLEVRGYPVALYRFPWAGKR